MKNKNLFLNLAACLTLAVLVNSAQAVSYDFTSDHITGGGGPPPFGSVTLTQDGTSVDFNVSLVNNNVFVKTGAGDFMYFKFNGTGVALADIVIDNQNFPGFTLSGATGAFSGDGTGAFAFGITSDHGNGGSPPTYTGPILFHVINSTIADFTTPNAGGYVFAADILATATGNTGPVAATTPNTVPDGGSTMMLLGSALGGLGVVRRFVRR